MVAAAVQLVGQMKEVEMLEVMVTVERGAVSPTATAWQLHPPLLKKPATSVAVLHLSGLTLWAA